MVPTCSYINNTRHFYRNRVKKDDAFGLRFAKTFMPRQSAKNMLRHSVTRKTFVPLGRLSSKDDVGLLRASANADMGGD